MNWTVVGLTTSVTRTDLTLLPGKRYFTGVRVKNRAGLYSLVSWTDGIRAPDATPPTAPGQPTEGSPTADLQFSGTGSYTIYWPAASDPESGIAAYELQERVGLTGAWTSLTANRTTTSYSVTGRLDKTRYFYQVRAQNGVGSWGPWSPTSNGILIDKTVPTPVTVTDDGAFSPSTTSLHARWSTSSDPESGIIDYQYCLKQDATSGTLLRNWTSVGAVTEMTAGQLTLVSGTKYFIGIRSKNGANLFSAVRYSDGITAQADTTPPVVTITSPHDGDILGAN